MRYPDLMTVNSQDGSRNGCGMQKKTQMFNSMQDEKMVLWIRVTEWCKISQQSDGIDPKFLAV